MHRIETRTSRFCIWLTVSLAGLGLVSSCGQSKSTSPAPSSSNAPTPPAILKPAAKVLDAGEAAPSFSLLGHTGMSTRPERFLAKPVALLFCPALSSETCSKALLVLRDSWLRLRPKLGMVIAVLGEDRIRLREYAYAQELPFLLASDASGEVTRAYGVGAAGSSAVQLFVLSPEMKVTTRLPEPDRDALQRWIEAL